MAKVKKKDGTLTKKYRDMPRFPVILAYEKDFKDGYSTMLQLGIADFTRELKKKLNVK